MLPGRGSRGRRGVLAFLGLATALAAILPGCTARTNPPVSVGATAATFQGAVTCSSKLDGRWSWQWRELGTSAWTSGGAFRTACGRSLRLRSFRTATLAPDTTYQYRLGIDAGHGAPPSWVDAGGRLNGTNWSDVTTQPQCDEVQGAESLAAFVASNPAGTATNRRVLCVRGGRQEIGQLNGIKAYTTLTPRGEADGTKQAVVLDGNVGLEQPGITLEDMRLVGCYRQAGCAADRNKTVDVRADETVLRHLDITQRGGRNSDVLQCVLASGDHPLVGLRIEFSKLHSCGSESSGNLEHGLYCDSARLAVIRGNWFYDNEGFGMQLYPDCDGAQVIGNVVAENGGACDVSGEDWARTSSATYRNGFCGYARENPANGWFPPIHCYGSSTANRAVDMVLYDPAARSVTDCGGSQLARSGTYDANPQFVDRDGYDFRMRNPAARAKLGIYSEILPGPRW